MKCIDAIEGTIKHVLTRIHAVSVEDKFDDTEYVRQVKAIIDATDQFIRNNPELLENPQLLRDELYRFSRELWLNVQSCASQTTDPPPNDAQEYQTYYYDYLYNRGNYPR
jgi:hypothetical protein